MSLETLKPKVAELIEKAQSGGNTDELEGIIDNSGVLDSTEGTVEEKVEQLIDKAFFLNDVVNYFENTPNLTHKFSYWKKATLPYFNFANATNFTSFVERSELESIDYYINSEKATIFSYAFQYTSKLKSIVGIDTSNVNHVSSMFYASRIETIQEPLNFSKVSSYGNCFNRCNSLANIKFVPETIKKPISFIDSPNLTLESIQSIIDGLATVETAQTLTLHADVKANLTQAQLDTITNKNWNLA